VAATVLLAPPFLAAAYVGGPVFLAVAALLTAAAAWEFGRLAIPARLVPRGLVMLLASASVAIRFVWPGSGPAAVGLTTVAVLAALTIGLAEDEPAGGLRTAALTLLGALYAGLFSYLVALRELPRELAGVGYATGFALLAAPVVLVWVTDIAAYAAGRAFGRRKLLPRVSPGKTVAGAVGGTAAAALAAVVLSAWAPTPLPRLGAPAAAALGAAVSVVAQAGDLAESLLKRACWVKDSSALIPGHGGVLDRFDSLLFAAPVAYYFFRATLA
jgi:phosphatidate cytidylyltransferase